MKSKYQKELHVRAAIQHLTSVMSDNRINSKQAYELIGQLAVLGKQLKRERGKK